MKRKRNRAHEPWTVFARTLSSGKVVCYYRVYDEERHTRTTAWTTMQSTKSAARAWVRALEAKGELIPKDVPDAPKPVTFGDIAEGFWAWDGEYVKARLTFSDPTKPMISRNYADDQARCVAKHILPTFRRRHLADLTPQEVEAWALRLRDGGLSGKRVNNIVSCMRVMLGEAYREKMIPWDPEGAIRSVGTAPKRRGTLTTEEVRTLFAEENIKDAWGGHRLYRAVNYVAAASGMRQGEILAVRDGDVHADYIHVAHSWDAKYGIKGTKTNQARGVPLLPRVREAVEPFLGSGGYVFSMNDGKTPTTGNRCTRAMYAALAKIGVPPEEREARNITFHSWRRWLNSTF